MNKDFTQAAYPVAAAAPAHGIALAPMALPVQQAIPYALLFVLSSLTMIGCCESRIPTDMAALFGPLDSFFVKQLVEMFEVLTGVETSNRYEIFMKTNPHGPVLFAKEHSDFCARQCLGRNRPFDLRINFVGTSIPLLTLSRAYACCKNEVVVRNAQDQHIGTIRQDIFACCERRFQVYDERENHLYTVISPWYALCVCFSSC
jgi:hypothetical protein